MAFLRIIAGELGGRRIRVPHGSQVRPTAERVREALFSILGCRVENARVLDAFAGSGALGFEALSRGAREVVFVESSPGVLRVLLDNVASLGLQPRCTVRRADAVAALARRRIEGPFDLILADPPYDSPDAERFLRVVGEGGWLAPGGTLVLERPVSAPVADPCAALGHTRGARYGDTRLDFYSP